MTDHEIAAENDPEGRLEDLQEEIDEVRRRVDDPLDQGENMFIQDGDEPDVETDDTIVPPG